MTSQCDSDNICDDEDADSDGGTESEEGQLSCVEAGSEENKSSGSGNRFNRINEPPRGTKRDNDNYGK